MKTEVEVLVRAFLAQSVERAAFNRKVVGSRPTGGVFLVDIWKKKTREGRNIGENRRAHSSVVEHRTAVPVVIGSNPIVPFFFYYEKYKHESERSIYRIIV